MVITRFCFCVVLIMYTINMDAMDDSRCRLPEVLLADATLEHLMENADGIEQADALLRAP